MYYFLTDPNSPVRDANRFPNMTNAFGNAQNGGHDGGHPTIIHANGDKFLAFQKGYVNLTCFDEWNTRTEAWKFGQRFDTCSERFLF